MSDFLVHIALKETLEIVYGVLSTTEAPEVEPLK